MRPNVPEISSGMEQHSLEFPEKRITLRGIPKFLGITYRNLRFAFRKFKNFRIFRKLSQEIFLPFARYPFWNFRNFWLNGKRRALLNNFCEIQILKHVHVWNEYKIWDIMQKILLMQFEKCRGPKEAQNVIYRILSLHLSGNCTLQSVRKSMKRLLPGKQKR